MAVATQLEVLDLRHFSARQLRPLLEQEARVWKARLLWDYESSIELLLNYLDSRMLPGFVALDRGRICGYTFCVYEGYKAVVGDLYADARDMNRPLPIVQTLLSHLLEMLQHSPNIDRIESQLLLAEGGSVTPSFVRAGFASYPRLFMECELSRGEDLLNSDLAGGLEVVGWSAAHYQAAAEVIQRSYVGHIDAQINDQYRTLQGSLRFLHNIVRFPGCGVFEAEASWMLQDGQGRLVGMILCSRVADGVAHITQLCVLPELRGCGLGRALLRHCMVHLAASGFTGITLTVTEANTQAVKSYERTGYKVRHRFDATVWMRPGAGSNS